MAEMTLFIDVSHFEATIMVALTSMLVMYTLYQSIAANLPQTAYLKMIDIWLIGGLMIPFIIFNILIAIDMLILSEKARMLEVSISSTKLKINLASIPGEVLKAHRFSHSLISAWGRLLPNRKKKSASGTFRCRSVYILARLHTSQLQFLGVYSI